MAFAPSKLACHGEECWAPVRMMPLMLRSRSGIGVQSYAPLRHTWRVFAPQLDGVRRTPQSYSKHKVKIWILDIWFPGKGGLFRHSLAHFVSIVHGHSNNFGLKAATLA